MMNERYFVSMQDRTAPIRVILKGGQDAAFEAIDASD